MCLCSTVRVRVSTAREKAVREERRGADISDFTWRVPLNLQPSGM